MVMMCRHGLAGLAAAVLLSALGTPAAFAGDPPANFGGRANNNALAEYTVAVQALEFCQAGSTAANCVGAAVVATGTKSFDIASATVGADVGSYGDIGALPIGSTFTHLRVTLSPIFTLTTPAAGVTGQNGLGGPDGGTCFTKSVNDNTNPANFGGGSAVAGSQPQVMVVPFPSDDGGPGTAPNTAQFNALNIHRPNATPTQMFFITELTAPFTPSIDPPLIEVKFDTVGAMAAVDGGADNCQFFYPLPPLATITITSP